MTGGRLARCLVSLQAHSTRTSYLLSTRFIARAARTQGPWRAADATRLAPASDSWRNVRSPIGPLPAPCYAMPGS